VFLLPAKIIRQCCLALALLGVLTLGGCSAVKFGYEQLPSLGYWWLDSQLDFSDAQTPRAREALDRLHRWHRQRELQLYADLLARMALLTEGTVQAQQVCQIERDVRQRLDALMAETVRQFGPVAAQLSASQVRHLGRQLELKNAKWEEQWLAGSPGQRLERRLDKVVDRYADFYGALSPVQTALLRSQLEQSTWTPEWGRQERLRQQRELLTALMPAASPAPSPEPMEARLLGVWERWLSPAPEAERQRWQAWIEQGCRHLAELHNSTSPEQRQRAARRLRAYERDLRELASRS
jgi:hypothetical protein